MSAVESVRPKLGVIGGSGDLGSGLVKQWLMSGYRVIIGSRSLEKAQLVRSNILEELGDSSLADNLFAEVNADAARQADIAVLTVPFSHHRSTLESLRDALQGKILVDVTVPLNPPAVTKVQLPEEGAAGQIAQNLLGKGTRVVSAFQNVAAVHLHRGLTADDRHKCDVLVCGDDPAARAAVVTLANDVGLKGIEAGGIANAAAAEAMTSLLIFINKHHKCHSGIRITGMD
ncbi:NADPH-dependent F420 reductase [Pseudomaricurvus alkylphenolicus]|uniref:NADPH-dependent F420 reductase n=1 Tax=Pseudomaricurvus alkylphenolicus TaxID=1306991 RepID=UPI001422E0A3|nr:NADPH-dependent F420 reductase [Pseudomaricurvus alkylphenolicus]NIB42152.1 NADPH-dependent F420 reductase [Pseudomaricurvus alkylphenolicus]